MKKKWNIRETGFKTPQNYFDGVEDAVVSKLNSHSGLSSIDETGFKMPEDSLDSVEDRVFKKLNEDSNSRVISLVSRRHLLYVTAAAAVVLIMFTILTNKFSTSESELDYEMVESYIINQEISAYELAALLTEEEIETINTTILSETFNESSVEDYLLDVVDFENLIE